MKRPIQVLLSKTLAISLLAHSCAAECTDNPKWSDLEGRTCEAYTNEPVLCSSVEGYLQGSHDNCCMCSLASQPNNSTNAPQQSPTSLPTLEPTSEPSSVPSARPTVCYDMSSWADSAGDDCAWYTTEPYKNRCTLFGNQYKNMGHTAKRACCGCGGGYYTAFSPSAAPSIGPTISPSRIVICRDNPTWQDEDGYNCRDYERDVDDDFAFQAGLTRCDIHGESSGAHKECCSCGGGYREPFVPSHAPTISFQPQSSDYVPPSPSPTSSTCSDIAGWSDVFGDDCKYYAEPMIGDDSDKNNNNLVESNKCSKFGMYGLNYGYTALTACCVCGGGVSKSREIYPANFNAPLRPIKPTLNITGDPCIDRPHWEPYMENFGEEIISDNNTFSCKNIYYKPKDGFVTCEQYGHVRSDNGVSCNEACCICGGGYSGSMIGRTFRVTFPGDASSVYTMFTRTTESGEKVRDGSFPRFLKEVANMTGFGMFEVPLLESFIEKADGDTYGACENQRTLGHTDICIGPFWRYGETINADSISLYTDEFYVVVKKPEVSIWELFLTPILPFTVDAWLWVIFSVAYMSFVINIIHKKGFIVPGKSWLTRCGSITFHGVMSFTGGETENSSDAPSRAEKFVLAGFAIFGLIILTAYTATSAAFLVTGSVGYESLADVVESGAKLCISARAYDAFLQEQPQTREILTPLNYNTMKLLDALIDDECEAVITTSDGYNHAQYTDPTYCQELTILRQEVVLTMGNVIPTHELLGAWGEELILQIDTMITTGIYARYHSLFYDMLSDSYDSDTDTYTYMNEQTSALEESSRHLKGGKGGKGGASAGGGANSENTGLSSACGEAALVQDSETYSLSSTNLFFPIFICVISSTVGLCGFLANRKRRLSVKRKLAESARWGSKLYLSQEDEDDLVRIKLNDESAIALYDMLKEMGVDDDDLNEALDELPNKDLLVELAFQKKCSDYRRDYDLLHERLSISELCILIVHYNGQLANSNSTRDAPTLSDDDLDNGGTSTGLSKGTSKHENFIDVVSNFVRRKPKLPSLDALNDHSEPKGELIEEVLKFPKLMMLARQCISAKKKTPHGMIFDISDYLNGFPIATQLNLGTVCDYGDEGFKICTEIPRLSEGLTSAATDKSEKTLFDQATVDTNDLLVNSLGNSPLSSDESVFQHVVPVSGRDGTTILFYG